MKAAAQEFLSPALRRTLVKFGANLGLARRKRGLTVAMMCERIPTSKATYLKVEKGDPRVSFGVYAMTLQVLGFGRVLSEGVDASQDASGRLLDEERVPKRVRPKKRGGL